MLNTINNLTQHAAQSNQADIHSQLLKLTKDYKLAKLAAKRAHKARDFQRWNEYMRLAKHLKSRLKITADWLHLSIYGMELETRKLLKGNF